MAAGTPILTPEGSRAIEELRVGDRVLSLAEDDPEGTPQPRRVVNVMANYAPLLKLVAGGRAIRTTAEHPFWVVGQGWRAAHQLVVGDVLMSHQKHPVAVEAIEGEQEAAAVYNVEVEGYHTYFVGSPGWAVWAHNANPCVIERNSPHLAALGLNGATHIIARNGDDVSLIVSDGAARIDVLFFDTFQHPDLMRAALNEARDQGATSLVLGSGSLVTPNSQSLMQDLFDSGRGVFGGVLQKVSQAGDTYPYYES